MKKILFFDATNRWILVESYLLSPEGELIIVQKYQGLHHRESSQRLVREIKICLEESGWNAPDLIVTATGPGSFTGIRISVSTARNLAQIWKIPALGFDSLDVYSAHYFQESGTTAIVAIEAKQSKIYFALRDQSGFWGSIDVLPAKIAEVIPEDRLSSYLTGIRYSDCPDFYIGENMENILPSSEALLRERTEEIKRAVSEPEEFSFLRLVPNYIRGTYADDKHKVFFK